MHSSLEASAAAEMHCSAALLCKQPPCHRCVHSSAHAGASPLQIARLTQTVEEKEGAMGEQVSRNR